MTLPLRVRPVRILCAEDDADDRALVQDALNETRLPTELHFVRNGEELLEYLRADKDRPDIIFLDLWMPKLDGCEALRAIKATPSLRSIPVVVITTSNAEEDVRRSYELGACSFVRKSTTWAAFVEVMHTIAKYWFETVDLPRSPESAPAVADRARRILVLASDLASWPPSFQLPSGLAVLMTTADPAEARKRLEHDESIDAAILDIGVPGALETLAAVRGLRPLLPMLAVSEDVFDAGRAHLAGAESFLQRPFDRPDIEATLTAIL